MIRGSACESLNRKIIFHVDVPERVRIGDLVQWSGSPERHQSLGMGQNYLRRAVYIGVIIGSVS
jgi:hypothetical protein